MLRARITDGGLDVLRHCDQALDEIEAIMFAEIDGVGRKSLAENLLQCARALRSESG